MLLVTVRVLCAVILSPCLITAAHFELYTPPFHNPRALSASPRVFRPTSRAYLGVAVSSDTLFAAAGFYSGTSTYTYDTFEAYTVATSTWATLPSMPSALLSPAVVEESGVIYVRRAARRFSFPFCPAAGLR